MSISYLLVLLALAALGGAIWALFWAIDSGQYDDVEQHALTPLEENGDIPDLLAKRDRAPRNGDASLPGR
jgi:cbb3-type cytochrome oxidase maturation protein